MGDVDGGAELGAFVNWRPLQSLVFSLKGYHGLGKAKGFTLDLGATYMGKITEKLGYSLGVSTMYSDSNYNVEFFGVNHAQSVASGYNYYAPGGGIKHAALNAGLSYDISESWKANLFTEYRRLTGPAKDSPLVKRGSANQFMIGLAFVWSFGK